MTQNNENQNVQSANESLNISAKVSIPIHTQANGFYRYNYTKERLEFINNQTRTVDFFREIPIDQWESIPSHQEYCINITNEANENKKIDKRASGAAKIVYILLFVAAPILLVILAASFSGSSPIVFVCILGAGITIILLIVAGISSK